MPDDKWLDDKQRDTPFNRRMSNVRSVQNQAQNAQTSKDRFTGPLPQQSMYSHGANDSPALSSSASLQPAQEEPVAVRRFTMQEIDDLAFHDAQTGVWNLRYTIRRLEFELKRAHHLQRPLCVLVVSLDRFVAIALEFGASDTGMQSLGLALRDHCGPIDMLGRFSEGRYILIVPELDRQEIEAYASKIKDACDAVTILHGNISFKLSVSIGVAVLWPGIQDAESMIAIADLGADVVSDAGGNGIAFAAELP